MTDVLIRELQPGDEEAFRRLNEEWIVRHFRLEPKDEYVLRHPRETVLAAGGRIWMAVRDEDAVGCCALVLLAPGEYEVAKMAVTRAAQGSGIGRLLLKSVIKAARDAGATRLYLETNHVLEPAIRLYRSLGFEYLPPGREPHTEYERADVFMELDLRREGGTLGI